MLLFADLISSSTQNDTPAVLGIFAIFVSGTFATAGLMLRQAAKRDKNSAEAQKADREERLHLASAINKMAANSGKQAEATKNGFTKLTKAQVRTADEAKERNGHLGEQTRFVAELVVENTKSIVKAVKEHHDQTVDIQHVKKQVIKKG